MILESGQIITLAAIVVPLVALVAVELVRGSPGSVRRYYGRFLAFGCVHGLILWVIFVWNHGHGAIPETWTDLAVSLTIFSIGALAVVVAFTLTYLATAFVLWHLRRLLRSQ